MSNIFWQKTNVTLSDRERLNKHKGAVIWLIGLSGAGKSTIALALEEKLFSMQTKSFILDGDNIRHGLCNDLSFSLKDRTENIRRISEVSKLFYQAGMITIVSFISPLKKDRLIARSLIESDRFFEVYCNCPLSVCEGRDVKGLYKQARQGKIKDFTGISSPYETPDNAELIINTDKESPNSSVNKIISLLKRKNIIL
jgi:adenylylsulfate kinase